MRVAPDVTLRSVALSLPDPVVDGRDRAACAAWYGAVVLCRAAVGEMTYEEALSCPQSSRQSRGSRVGTTFRLRG